jgi:hypothetical protein
MDSVFDHHYVVLTLSRPVFSRREGELLPVTAASL